MIRVRGIYTTSLVGLLSELGFAFSDITEKIRERVRDARSIGGPVAVTVKDLEDRKGVTVIGESELVRLVAYSIAAVIPESFVVYIDEGPYTSMTVRVLEKLNSNLYKAELPDGRIGVLKTLRPVGSGEIVSAHVVRPDPTEPFLREGIAVVGKYARLIEREKHGVSEHIRDYERAGELLSAAQMLSTEGWGVRFRSSAANAPLIEVMSEVRSLVEKGVELKGRASKSEKPSLISRGEAIAFVHFSLAALAALDSVRNRYYPTIPLHHLIKSTGLQELCDRVDEIESKNVSDLSSLLPFYAEVFHRVLRPGTLVLEHRKLRGRQYTWTANAAISKEGFILLSRSVHAEGVYDGIGIPKNAGDSILSVTSLFSRTLAHFYFDSNGELKGAYVNINTPLDFVLYPRPKLTYIDLCVDVVRVADEVRIIDEQEFRSLVTDGAILERDAASYDCLAREAASILGSFSTPAEVAHALQEAQGKCFKRDRVEELRVTILEKVRGL